MKELNDDEAHKVMRVLSPESLRNREFCS